MAKKPQKKPKFKKARFVDLENWRALLAGDTIKSIMGYGPEFLLKTKEIRYMGEYGTFRVQSVAPTGIFAQSPDLANVFIYMGDERKMETGTLMKPHRLKILVKPA